MATCMYTIIFKYVYIYIYYINYVIYKLSLETVSAFSVTSGVQLYIKLIGDVFVMRVTVTKVWN